MIPLRILNVLLLAFLYFIPIVLAQDPDPTSIDANSVLETDNSSSGDPTVSTNIAENSYDETASWAILRTFDIKANTNFTIGGLFPLRLNAPSNAPDLTGIERAEAFKCAIAVINQDNSILPDVQLLYQVRDTRDNDPTRSLFAASRFDELLVSAVVGAASSSNTESAAKLLGYYGTPVISYASSSDALSKTSDYPSFLRTLSRDSYQINAILSVMRAFDWTLITGLFSDSSYGASGYTAFMDRIAKHKSTSTAGSRYRLVQHADHKKGEAIIVQTCSVQLRSEQFISDVRAQIQCIRNTGVKVVLLFMSETEATRVLREFGLNGDMSDITFIASDAWAKTNNIPTFASVAPMKMLQGTIGILPQPGNLSPIMMQCLQGVSPTVNQSPIFQQYWQTRFRCSLDKSNYQLPLCDNRLMSRPLAQRPACRCTGGEQFFNPDNHDSKLTHVYDATYAIANALHFLNYQCNDIPGINYDQVCNKSAHPVIDLTNAMRALKFNGTTGPVSFKGNDRAESEYQIVQLQPDGSWKVVGDFKGNGTLNMRKDDLFWTGGATPVSTISPYQTTYKDSIGIFVNLMAGIGIIISISLMVYFYVNRNSKVIRQSSWRFCELMLFGLLLCYASLLTFDGLSAASCATRFWLLGVGFALIMGNLLAKTYRIWKIFNNKRVASLLIKDKDLMFFSGIALCIEIAILIAWTAVDGGPQPVVIVSDSVLTYSYVSCSGRGTVESFLIYLLLGYNSILVIGGCIIAYLTRHVDSAYNESQHIAFAMYNMVLLACIIIPVYYLTGDGVGSELMRYSIRSSSVLFAASFTLVTLFLPKVGELRKIHQVPAVGRKSEGVTRKASQVPPKSALKRRNQDNQEKLTAISEESSQSQTQSRTRIMSLSSPIVRHLLDRPVLISSHRQRTQTDDYEYESD